MGQVATSFGSIGFAEAGSGAALPIVFLHGVGSDKSVWAPQLVHFGEHRRAIAFDYPGYGDSDPAPGGTSRDDYASAILQAMTALGIDRAHVCGLSLGGVVAIAIHAQAPRQCASLIIADSFAVHPNGPAIYERSVAASHDMRALAEARVAMLLTPVANSALGAEVVETMARLDPAAYRSGAEAVWLADQRDRAVLIDVPSLVLCGGEDKVTPPELSRDLCELIDGAELIVIDGAGHLSNIERPDEFNRAVTSFVQKAESRTD